jgi:mono/diheme cytochrome c family protein
VLLAITSEGKIGLGVLAGLLILFALLSAFYFPRRDPNFPGDRLGLFVIVAVVLFAGTIAGVVFFAAEEEGAEATEVQGTDTGQEQETTAATTESGPTESEPTESAPTESEPSEQAEGDPAAGEAVFASAGCGGCHTLEAAGSSGNVGPNLDEAKPPHDLVVERVTNGMGAMPSFKGQLDDEQIQDVAAYVVESTQG